MPRTSIRQALLSLAGLAAAALLASTQSGPLQSPAPQDKATQDAPADEEPVENPRGVTGWSIEPKWEPLLGTWTLMTFAHPNEVMNPESVRGFLTITEGFLTMVIHARPTDGVNDTEMPDQLAQAGIYRWRMEPERVLQLATVIGHSNFGTELQWERANDPREFRVELDEDTLVLVRPDIARLTFRRVRSADFPQSALDRMRELRGTDD